MKRIISMLLIFVLCTAGCSGLGEGTEHEVKIDPSKCETPIDLKFEYGNNLFSWNNNNSQNPGNFEVQYGNQGFSLGNGTIAVTNSTSFSIPLYKNRKYDLYVRKNCGTDNVRSHWAGPLSILTTNATLCETPYYANYSKMTSSAYAFTFEAKVSWENDGISMYEAVLTTSPVPPVNGDLTAPGHIYTGLNKMTTYNFFVRKRCSDNSVSKFYGPLVIKWN
ncbi:hypothetical protein [Chryseobacterium arthrosphaerae]|uniref:hypothetical protein n=1 Tax=Chryseobacterium arthrosphaerae TaxID=651561 RepID=UPI000F500B8C|nr:hypothetical protein [Chryseobacterium arthrosphaerae]